MRRRKLLRNCGISATGLAAFSNITSAAQDGKTESHTWHSASEHEAGMSITGSRFDGNVEVDLETGILQHPAVAATGPNGQSYWAIDVDFISNALTRYNPSHTNELTYELNAINSKLVTKEENNQGDNSDYWHGGGELANPEYEQYDGHATAVAEAIVGSIKYVGTAITAVEMVGHLLAMQFDDTSPTYRGWEREYGFTTSEGPQARQGEIYNRLQLHLSRNQVGDFTLTETAYAYDAGVGAYTEFDVEIEAPSWYPTSSGLTTSGIQQDSTTSVIQQNDHKEVIATSEGERIVGCSPQYLRANPSEHHLTPQEIDRFESDKIYFAPVKGKVEARAGTKVLD